MITVEINQPACSSDAGHHHTSHAADTLATTLESAQIPATWGLGERWPSALTDKLLASQVAHEIAVHGDQSWLTDRPTFAKKLAQQTASARAVGIPTTTLLIRRADEVPHVDLLVKQGITAVYHGQVATGRRNASPRSLHYGVWQIPAAVRMRKRLTWFTRRRLLTGVRRAIADGATFHLLIDAAVLQRLNSPSRSSLVRLLEEIALHRDRGFLQVETMSMAAARLSDVPAATPQQSILRRAA